LKGMGSETGDRERTTQLPEYQAHHANADHR